MVWGVGLEDGRDGEAERKEVFWGEPVFVLHSESAGGSDIRLIDFCITQL